MNGFICIKKEGGDYCRSPTACAGFDYCRERNQDGHGMSPSQVARRKRESDQDVIDSRKRKPRR